ncbi:MAG: type II secretion system protein [Cycloclasticus sp.]
MKLNKYQAGFTLLELLMVVSIMSATAYVALGTLNNDSNNQRYQSTIEGLLSIRRGLVGRDAGIQSAPYLQSGYVVDNGGLPASIDELSELPTDFLIYASQAPIFDPQPDADGMNDGSDGVELSADKQKLYKGFRSSSYLYLKPGAERSTDGWGNEWLLTQPQTDYWQLTSYGRNNQLEGDELFDADISETITKDAWQLDMAAWQVSVSNQSGTDMSVDLGQCLRLSLLVFQNSATEARWKRLTSDCISGTAASGSCLDGDGDGQVLAMSCPSSATVTFPSAGGGTGNYQPATQIPQGEHLLVLLNDSDASDAHDGSSESVYSADSHLRVRFYAGMMLPVANLVIR